MGIQLQQTDTAAADGAIAACSALTVASSPNAKQATAGGAAGSAAQNGGVDDNTKVYASVMAETKPGDLDTLSCPAGNWTYRFNCQTIGHAPVWDQLFICRVNSLGVSQATIASVTGLGIAITPAVVSSVTVAGTQQNLSTGDRIYIVLGFKTTNGLGATFSFKSDQLIDTPLVAATPPVTPPVVSNIVAKDPNLPVVVPGTAHTIHTTAKALYGTELSAAPFNGSGLVNIPANASGLTALAMQLASDYWNWQTSVALDEVYPGTYAWQPEGFHDIIWTYSPRARQATTRVMRTQWNLMIKEMQHSTPPLVGRSNIERGVGGPSVAQTVRDSYLNNANVAIGSSGSNTFYDIQSKLGAPLAVGDLFASFTTISYFPTQNRWYGQIENEVILFEGTSGGIGTSLTPVDIVLRGTQGTLAAPHITGAVVHQIAPNTAYGVNLKTWEKAQFVFPQQVTSGGIQGANVVPQTQSVLALDGTMIDQTTGVINGGVSVNGVLQFSGRVLRYDPWSTVNTLQTPIPAYDGLEYCWIVERNNYAITSGKVFDGTLAGFSADQPHAAPIYNVNDVPAPPTSQWFCHRFTSADGAGFSYCSQDSNPLNSTETVTGPFGSQNECEINCTDKPPTRSGPQPQPGCGYPITYGFPVYDNHVLEILPCSFPATLKTTGPPYPPDVISTLRNAFGLDFVDTGFRTTNPPVSRTLTTGGQQWWCHIKIPIGPGQIPKVCNQNPFIEPDDEGEPTGPYQSESECSTECLQTQNAKWYCHNQGDGVPYCSFNHSPDSPTDVVTGPFDDEATCMASCSTSNPPPDQILWYCHKNPTGSFCSQDPHPQPDDISVLGPYPDGATCQANCKDTCTIPPTTPPPTPMYWCHKRRNKANYCSQSAKKLFDDEIDIVGPFAKVDDCEQFCNAGTITTIPGQSSVKWSKRYSQGEGDTGAMRTAVLKATVQSPPNTTGQSTLINFSPPGGVSNSAGPNNFKDSCTITWSASIDVSCGTVDIQANWTGLTVFGNATAQPFGDPTQKCQGSVAGNFKVDTLTFDPCDFVVITNAGSCPNLNGVQVNTNGFTGSISVLDPACVIHTLGFRDGLLQFVYPPF